MTSCMALTGVNPNSADEYVCTAPEDLSSAAQERINAAASRRLILVAVAPDGTERGVSTTTIRDVAARLNTEINKVPEATIPTLVGLLFRASTGRSSDTRVSAIAATNHINPSDTLKDTQSQAWQDRYDYPGPRNFATLGEGLNCRTWTPCWGAQMFDITLKIPENLVLQLRARFQPAGAPAPAPAAPPSPPTVASILISPASVPQGAHQVVTITGTSTHFSANSQITFDDATGLRVVGTTVINDRQITVTIHAAGLTATGSRSLIVVSPLEGGANETVAGQFTIERREVSGAPATPRVPAPPAGPRPPAADRPAPGGVCEGKSPPVPADKIAACNSACGHAPAGPVRNECIGDFQQGLR